MKRIEPFVCLGILALGQAVWANSQYSEYRTPECLQAAVSSWGCVAFALTILLTWNSHLLESAWRQLMVGVLLFALQFSTALLTREVALRSCFAGCYCESSQELWFLKMPPREAC